MSLFILAFGLFSSETARIDSVLATYVPVAAARVWVYRGPME